MRISVEIIKIHHPHGWSQDQFQPMVIALGYFDGVHLGHQQVITAARDYAKKNQLKSAVMTFDPHPSVVLRKNIQHVEYITPLAEKCEQIKNLDVDYLFIVQFTHEFADLLPQQFVDQYLIGLNVAHVVAGFDYSYGRMGKGTMETLPFHARGKFDFTIVSKFTLEDEKISSTLIRSYIKDGKMQEIFPLLGRYYTTTGTVIHGDKRGRTIGFPTANTAVETTYMIPPIGVYTVRFFVKGNWYNGICNIGFKPTFRKDQSEKPSVEVHIFDFNEEIYGQDVVIEWHDHIRSEQKFSSAAELIAQLEEDKQTALAYFKKNHVASFE